MSSSGTFKQIINKKKMTARPQELSNLQRQDQKAAQTARINSLPQAVVNGIFYRTLSKSRLEDVSVASITSQLSSNSSQPQPSTALDPRLGNVDYRFLCATCGTTPGQCNGHMGHIPLVSKGEELKVISIPFKPFIPMCLKTTCEHCGNLLITDDVFHNKEVGSYKAEKRLKLLEELTKGTKSCPYCHRAIGVINSTQYEKDNKLMYSSQDKTTVQLSVEEIYNRLRRITDDTVKKLGFTQGSHPVDFIISQVPVMPTAARPSSFVSGGINQVDGITRSYDEIVKMLKGSVNRDLQQALTTQIGNLYHTKDKLKLSPNQAIVTIKKLVDNKKGAIRDKILGKRKNHTGRNVLTSTGGAFNIGSGELYKRNRKYRRPRLKIRFGQIGIPKTHKKTLYITETVTVATYNKYYQMFGNSFSECKIGFVIYETGDKKGIACKVNEVSWKKHKESFKPGDKIRREPYDEGDVILFNRQPTLNADSMVGYTSVYTDDNYVIRLHMANTASHNADFDGDEGNLHQPQTMGMRLEQATFAHVSNRIISVHTNSPNVGVLYNGISAAMILTNDKIILDEPVWFKGYFESEEVQGKPDSATFQEFRNRLQKYNINPLSGKALISSLFPNDFFYKKGIVQFKEGIMISGVLTKEHVGRSANSLVQSMFSQYGKARTCDFITQIYFLLDWYIPIRGLTVTYDDCALQGRDYRQMYELREQAIRKAQMKIIDLKNTFNSPSDFEKKHVESQTLEYLRGIREEMSTFLKTKLNSNNPMMIMTTSGAKGTETYLAQISCIVGQQLISGKRPEQSLSSGKRDMPQFGMNSMDIFARGFCKHSFSEGLDPVEFFEHAKASRVGSLDTVEAVPRTGYIQRRITKTLEDIMVSTTGSVVNALGSEFNPVSFDGFNPTYLNNNKGPQVNSLISIYNFSEIAEKINSKY